MVAAAAEVPLGLVVGVSIGGAVAAAMMVALIAFVVYKAQHPVKIHASKNGGQGRTGGQGAFGGGQGTKATAKIGPKTN
ncbi:protein ORF106 [Cyprinid herpesvirus 3]|uniref:ORF106R n=1 Tax=Cyprinid herpesvirus 3 TaxID=180230 RepID=A3QMS4_CYHV3|nr:unnamed protein product [Cyprinid herpesvirus 3]ABF81819.1 hypothetical protein [Cyprinid herpesvirus 3]ABG42933.1 protein ORF106 [Cyprinid herpesvirus 3]AIC32461.1 ORF106R [Cyprinid herpesvirus 3]AJP55594.1 protein ORF106 [Cyprinid herpesvirus 3]AJP55749.1 protein ORF106 [Cyprinid herpesvirus 3]